MPRCTYCSWPLQVPREAFLLEELPRLFRMTRHMIPVYLHSIKHRCPLGSAKAIISGSMSSTDMPSNEDI